MIRFIKSNFKTGAIVKFYINDGTLISGNLIELGDEEIKIQDSNGAILLLKCNNPNSIDFTVVKPQIVEADNKAQEHPEQITQIFVPDNKPSELSSSTISIFLNNDSRFKACKFPPDGRMSKNYNTKELYVYNYSDGKEKQCFPANVIDDNISSLIKNKASFQNEEVNYILETNGKVCCIHNLNVESLLRLSSSQEDKRKKILNYIRKKIERMMPGGDPIEVKVGSKYKNYKLTDNERCHYILRLLDRILNKGNDDFDIHFKTEVLDLKVQTIEKQLESNNNRKTIEELEMALINYLECATPLKKYLGIQDIIVSNRYARLAQIQIQLGRSRETIIKNANKACEFAQNNHNALVVKEKAEKLPRDVWHDNRDIQIVDGETEIIGLNLSDYQMDQEKVEDFLLNIKDADSAISNRIVDSIKDYYWTTLLDDSTEEEKKRNGIDGFLKFSLAPQSKDKGIDLLRSFLYSDDVSRKESAWYALICIGSASKNAWNLLLSCKGMKDLYEFFEEDNRPQTYQFLNKVSDLILDTDLPAYKFLRTIFNQRRDQINKLLELESRLFIEEIRYFDDIIDCLNIMRGLPVFNSTEKNDILARMFDIVNSLKSYETYDDDERIIRLTDATEQLKPIINLVKNYPTFFGHVLFKAPLFNWQEKIGGTRTQKKSLRQPKFSVYSNPPYIQKQDKGGYYESFFNICIENIGQQSADGYKLDITLTPEDTSIEAESNSIPPVTIKVGAGNKDSKRVPIPMSMQGANVINVSIDAAAFFGGRWLQSFNSRFTLYISNEASDSYKDGDNKFKIGAPTLDDSFKGRESDMDILKNHYLGKNRSEIYILYGLSRTGKTSIALNLMKQLEGKYVTSNNGRNLLVIPFSWPIDIISEISSNDSLWYFLIYDAILTPFCDEYKNKYKLCLDVESMIKDQYNVTDFLSILSALNKAGVYPFFVLDEFQYMKKLLVRKNTDKGANLSEAFIHSIRQYASQGLASFLFAGTYEIKDLMHNPIYELNKGQFGTTKEKKVNRIEARSAEELMNIMGEKLQFTREAILYIHKLSYDVPYFIQIICYHCANYALMNHRYYFGYPELNHIVNCLTGEESGKEEGIPRIPEGWFIGNMVDPSHPMEDDVLRYITLYNQERTTNPRPVGYTYIKDLWEKEYPDRSNKELSETLDMLIEKEIITVTNDREYNEITYSINVDLFRRWFTFKEKRINN